MTPVIELEDGRRISVEGDVRTSQSGMTGSPLKDKQFIHLSGEAPEDLDDLNGKTGVSRVVPDEKGRVNGRTGLSNKKELRPRIPVYIR